MHGVVSPEGFEVPRRVGARGARGVARRLTSDLKSGLEFALFLGWQSLCEDESNMFQAGV